MKNWLAFSDLKGQHEGWSLNSYNAVLLKADFARRIKELDVKRNYYDNTTWCMCQFDHWCNSAPNSMTYSMFTLASLSSIPIIFTLFRK